MWDELITYSCDLLYFRDKVSDTQKDWKFFEVSPLLWGLFVSYENNNTQQWLVAIWQACLFFWQTSFFKRMTTYCLLCPRILACLCTHKCEYTGKSAQLPGMSSRWVIRVCVHLMILWGLWEIFIAFPGFVIPLFSLSVLLYFLYLHSLDCLPTPVSDRDWGRSREAFSYQYVQHSPKETRGWRVRRREEAHDVGAVSVWPLAYFLCVVFKRSLSV